MFTGMDFNCNVNLHWDKISNRDEKLMYSYINRRKMEIKQNLIDQLGSNNVVKLEISKHNKYIYNVNCPYSRCNYSGDKLARHFQQVHLNSCTQNMVNLFKSRQVRLYNYYTKLFGSKEVKPLPCLLCYRYFDRLRTHVRTIHGINSELEEILKTSKDIDTKLKNLFLNYRW